jgi:hypothetical protein
MMIALFMSSSVTVATRSFSVGISKMGNRDVNFRESGAEDVR